MKKAIAVAMILGLAACGGEKPKLAPLAELANVQVVAAPAEPAKPDPDKELGQRVARAMADAKLYGVDVAVAGGVVTLWGSTTTEKERGHAVEIAGKVEGVKAVENRLDIVNGS